MIHELIFPNTKIYQTLLESCSHNELAFIAKVLYWINNCGKKIAGDERLWIYNTLNEWAEQLSMSLYKIKKIIKNLEERSILIPRRVNAHKWNQTKSYTINFEHPVFVDVEFKGKYFAKLAQYTNQSKVKKSTDRLVENQPIFNIQYNNYKNTSSIEELVKEKVKEKRYFFENPNVKKKKVIELKIEEKKIGEKMIEEWNKIFSYSNKPIKAYGGNNNYKQLFKVWQEVFGENIEKWKEYAFTVNGSKFLMGEKTEFKARFEWLLREDVIQNVLNGKYGMHDRILDKDNLPDNLEKAGEELAGAIHAKIAFNLTSRIDEAEIEFKDYITSMGYLRDQDRYEIGHYFRCLAPHTLITNSSYRWLYESIYNSYLSKKYGNVTHSDISKKVKEFVGQTNSTGAELLQLVHKATAKVKNISSEISFSSLPILLIS